MNNYWKKTQLKASIRRFMCNIYYYYIIIIFTYLTYLIIAIYLQNVYRLLFLIYNYYRYV